MHLVFGVRAGITMETEQQMREMICFGVSDLPRRCDCILSLFGTALVHHRLLLQLRGNLKCVTRLKALDKNAQHVRILSCIEVALPTTVTVTQFVPRLWWT